MLLEARRMFIEVVKSPGMATSFLINRYLSLLQVFEKVNSDPYHCWKDYSDVV